MSSTSERATSDQTRTYDRASSVVFLKTDEPFGGLSNMAGGFPLYMQGTRIYTSEALYQACRFPHLPEIQRLIVGQASPMTAKMKSKPHRQNSRPDWDRVRVKVMRWCLRAKLAQNWTKFSELLLRTEDRAIVEESRKDDFWGAKPADERTLVGMNVLGRLLMELREAVKSQGRDAFRTVEPPDISDFLLFGKPIGAIGERGAVTRDAGSATASAADRQPIQEHTEQASLFDSRSAREAPAPAYIADVTPQGAHLGDLKPYPAMKDSGVPWLGEVPEHWNVRRLRNLADMRVSNVDKRANEDEQPVRLCNYMDVYKNDYIRTSMSFMRATATREEIARFRLAAGDVLITKDSESWNDIGVPALVCESADDLVSGYHLALLRPIDGRIASGYLFRALQSTGVQCQFHVEANGVTRYGLSHAAIKSVWLPTPPLPEQAAIVRFLGHVDRRIRRYIRAKQDLIKLLEEQKQVIIHRAVTRGLDPNVCLTSSGVEWLGEMPEHWEVRRVKTLFRLRTEKSGVAHGRELLSIYTHIGVRPRKDLEERGNKASTTDDYWVVKRGDIIANKLLAWMGAVGVSHYDGVTSPAYDILMPIVDLFSDYYHHLFRTKLYLEQFKQRSRGIMDMRLRLYFDQFGQILVPVPPANEQRAIVAYYNDATKDVDRTMNRARDEIRLLHEYRGRLVADVVTGKLDVREAAAQLPDEVEELESPEETDTLGDSGEEIIEDFDASPEEAEV